MNNRRRPLRSLRNLWTHHPLYMHIATVFTLLVFLAVLVALSRIMVGAHWPADVLAGAGSGLAVALLESDLAERITARLAHEAPFAEGWRSCPE
jgi:di/tricarboxylate transporter